MRRATRPRASAQASITSLSAVVLRAGNILIGRMKESSMEVPVSLVRILCQWRVADSEPSERPSCRRRRAHGSTSKPNHSKTRASAIGSAMQTTFDPTPPFRTLADYSIITSPPRVRRSMLISPASFADVPRGTTECSCGGVHNSVRPVSERRRSVPRSVHCPALPEPVSQSD